MPVISLPASNSDSLEATLCSYYEFTLELTEHYAPKRHNALRALPLTAVQIMRQLVDLLNQVTVDHVIELDRQELDRQIGVLVHISNCALTLSPACRHTDK